MFGHDSLLLGAGTWSASRDEVGPDEPQPVWPAEQIEYIVNALAPSVFDETFCDDSPLLPSFHSLRRPDIDSPGYSHIDLPLLPPTDRERERGRDDKEAYRIQSAPNGDRVSDQGCLGNALNSSLHCPTASSTPSQIGSSPLSQGSPREISLSPAMAVRDVGPGTTCCGAAYAGHGQHHSDECESNRNTRVIRLKGLLPAKKKKQDLACLFCRQRKISCKRPDGVAPNHQCLQCNRRNRPCEYPTESRRGHHKRRRKEHLIQQDDIYYH